MKATVLRDALPGERLLAVEPPLRPDSLEAPGRLNFHDGRSLSAGALEREQRHLARRLAASGRFLEPGVIAGLEPDLVSDIPGGERDYLEIAVGSALSVGGEDLVLGRGVRVPIAEIPVHAPSSLLADSVDGGEAAGSWPIGPRFGELADPESPLPRVLVIVLRPVAAGMVGEGDVNDPCELAPEDYAFEDWQWVDALHVVLHAWPEADLALPERDERWRNRLANAVFAAEQALDPGARLPWWSLGVPVGLVAFDEQWTPLFVDHHSVARRGGGLRQAWSPVPWSGYPGLWQARMEQFAEHLAGNAADGLTPEETAAELVHLPPAGLLPREAVDPRAGVDRFFPLSYYTEALPVPLEQLDAIIRDSLSMAPFDTLAPDRVQVMVPVPQSWYEPDLLVVEELDPEFDVTIAEFSRRRSRWLRRRGDMRDIASALVAAARGAPPEYPDPDPDALEEEAVAEDPLDPNDPELADPEQDYGTELADGERVVPRMRALRQFLGESTPLRHESAVPVDSLPANLQYPDSVAGRIRFEVRASRLVFTGVMNEVQRDELIAFFQAMGRRDAVERVPRLFELSQRDEVSRLDELGLTDFIRFLESKVDQANDKVDFGFLRVQTEIYRTRQLVLGNVDATRLATSPVLAAIAQGETAVATREDLQKYLQVVRESGSSPRSPTAPRAARPVGFAASPSAGELFVSGDLGGGTFRPVIGRPGRGGGVAVGTTTGVFDTARPVRGTPVERVVREQEKSSAGLFGGGGAASREEILEKDSIVGATHEFRNVTVADRLETPPAQEAKTSGLASKYEVMKNLLDLDLEVDDLEIPGFRIEQEETRRSVGAIRQGGLLAEILAGQHDQNPRGLEDEGAFFSAGVRAMENSVATLRLIEGRVQAYRRAIKRCRKDLEALESDVAAVDGRLKIIGDRLGESRHDVAVARALKAEEEARIGDVNARRDDILAEHVPFLAFRRPNLVDETLDSASRTLDPALREAPVPACLREPAEDAPPELQETVDLLREAPLHWLLVAGRIMGFLDRSEDLRMTVVTARARARDRVAFQAVGMRRLQSGGRIGAQAFQLFAAQQQTVAAHRGAFAVAGVETLLQGSLTGIRRRVSRVLSLGDVIDNERRIGATRLATAELARIHRVAACLYRRFSDVSPSIRLDWTERLSGFDAGFSLRNLYALPRWDELDRLERRDMQELVDWLHGRVDPRDREAAAYVNTLVRVCLLLASHAPVGRVIAAQTVSAGVSDVGSKIDIRIDPVRARIGLSVMIYVAAEPVATAVLEDLEEDRARVRIVRTTRAGQTLPPGSRVQVGASEASTAVMVRAAARQA